MEIVQNITLDFARSTMPVTVFAKQYDKDTRKIEITPLNKGMPYTIESGVTARLQMTKPDGTTVIDDATISSGKITVTLTGQCLTAAGTAVAEIGLYKGATLLTSQIFYIEVQRGAYDENAPESSDEYLALLRVLAECEEAIDSIEAKVPKTRKIAGIDLQADITAQALKTALSVPTKTSDLTNDSGFLTQHQDISGKADYTVLTTLSAIDSAVENGKLYRVFDSESSRYYTILACSNDYNHSQLRLGYGGIVATRYQYLNNNNEWTEWTEWAPLALSSAIPTKTSDLNNDSGFLTQHQDISGKENSSNKQAAITSQNKSSETLYPSIKAVADYVDTVIGGIENGSY